MSLPEEQSPLEEPLSPMKDAIRLGRVFCDTKSKKGNGGGNQFIGEEPFIDERKPSSTMVEKSYLNNCEHTLIPVTAKIIHSAVYE